MKAIDHHALYNNAPLYDLMNAKITEQDLPFYMDAINSYGDPILELACGTGRLTIPIYEKGHDITGIDISEAMVNHGLSKTKTIDLRVGDIRQFKLERKFSLILLPFNSICHLHDHESIFSCLESIKAHLKPEGRCIIDVFNPSLEHLTRAKEMITPIGNYQLNGSQIQISETNRYNTAEQINYIKWQYTIDGVKSMVDLNMRMFFPQELDNYLKCAGFEIEQKYGNFDRSEFNTHSEKQLLIVKK
ncbi:MAG: class I SAM-dependent methyltransferase [Winogradskyella sp.]|nr:class I SAM-dependent methyltransferase [Winogradskyella sp.]